MEQKVYTTQEIDIMRDDLREIIFLEDEKGRFRERIMDAIELFGITNWFKAKGYPISLDSIWKNRYTGDKDTLAILGLNYCTWENYLPLKHIFVVPYLNEYKHRIKQVTLF